MAVKKKTTVIKKTTLKDRVVALYTQHRRLLIWVVCLVVLAVLLWFVFRKVREDQAENKAERELLLRQREEAMKENERIRAEAIRKEDSLIMEMLGITNRVEYRIQWRTQYVEKYIDTASISTKFFYIDSLLGPK